MRVIAGKFRSRRLKSPRRLRLRPTSDRLRETLFNVLGAAVEDSLFVDIFAGTGGVGIEALSRGAREVVFIEMHPAAVKLIQENLVSLGVRSATEVLALDALEGLQKLAARHAQADFLFLDPPYAETDEHVRVLEFLDGSHLVAPRGLVIAEHSRRAELPEIFERLERVRLLEEGDAALSFYRLAMAA